MMGSSGRLPHLTDRATKRKPKEGPSDLCVFHMARRSNDERAGRARDELLISLTRPRGGVFGILPPLFETKADRADRVGPVRLGMGVSSKVGASHDVECATENCERTEVLS
jgi:hypothetical protein